MNWTTEDARRALEVCGTEVPVTLALALRHFITNPDRHAQTILSDAFALLEGERQIVIRIDIRTLELAELGKAEATRI